MKFLEAHFNAASNGRFEFELFQSGNGAAIESLSKCVQSSAYRSSNDCSHLMARQRACSMAQVIKKPAKITVIIITTHLSRRPRQ
jgi:hypothetical protein